MIGFIVYAACLLTPSHIDNQLPKIPVTAAVRATTVEKALNDLAMASGFKFEVDPSLQKEVIAFRVNQVPMDDLLNRAADLLLAKWSYKEGQWTLVPDEVKEKAARDKAAQVQLRYARGILDRARKEASELPKWSTGLANDTLDGAIAYQKTKLLNDPEDTEQLLELTRNIPGTRAAIRAMALLTPEQIALAFKGRTVLADKPTQFQYQLPAQISQIVNTCIEEQNAYADVADAKLGQPDPK